MYFYPEKYPYHIGRISTEGSVQLDSIKKYKGKSIVGYYSSSAPKIFKGSKYQFRQNVLKQFNGDQYTDTGYLNYRFYINDKGKVIMYKVNEMNLDLQPSKLNDNLVDDLTKIITQEKHWFPFTGKDITYYMHLTFRIENGKITEIIP